MELAPRLMFVLLAVSGLPLACGDDEKSGDSPGSGGSAAGKGSAGKGSGGGVSGGMASGGESGTSGGSAGGAEGGASMSGSAGSDGGACPAPDLEACSWDAFDGLVCDAPGCCGSDVSCISERCYTLCGGVAADISSAFEGGVEVLTQFCDLGGHASVLRQDGTCERPVLYEIESSFDFVVQDVTITLSRQILSPLTPRASYEQVQQLIYSPESGSNGTVDSQSLAINPSETLATFSVSLMGTDALFVMDLATGTAREVPGLFLDKAVWLDDARFLLTGDELGSTTVGGQHEGLWLVDASGVDLEYTFVAGRIRTAGALGIVANEVAFIGGTSVVAGPLPAVMAIPLSMIDEVVGGTREPIDVFADVEVQRFERQGVTAVDNSAPGGRWYVSATDLTQATFQIEELSVLDGVLTFGPATPLVQRNNATLQFFHAGADRLVVSTPTHARVVRIP